MSNVPKKLLLVVITGPPGNGKTTLARKLAVELRMPALSMDTIKEALFDELRAGDREWSTKLTIASSTPRSSA